MPNDAVKANFDGVLTGKTRDMWVHWQDHILRGHESQGSDSDPRLKSFQRLYMGLLMQMVRAGMIDCAGPVLLHSMLLNTTGRV